MKDKLNKVLKLIKSGKIYLITFTVAVVIISLLYVLNDVTPFGSKSLLCVDFFHQYGPMMAELYDRVYNGSSLIYSFNMGLGLPFFRNFFNYLSSPFNLIMFLFNRSNLITSYSYIIGAKAVFASVTMVYYLTKKFNSKSLFYIALGLIYGFSAYFGAYYWDLMWLDGMVFTPLIVLNIEKVVNEGKWKGYTLWLALMLFSNYFIGYMVCIFSVVYFLIYNIYKTHLKKGHIKESIKLFLKRCLYFGISSLLAGGLVAVALLPMYLSMSSISATGGKMPTTQYYAFKLEDFLKYHLTGVTTTVFASDDITAPNISCGILGVGLLLAYLLNLDIPIKNKICYLCLLGFFILAFFWAPLDYILTAFHVPNDLPYRYSFLYTFVMVIIAGYSITYIHKNDYRLMLLGYVFLMALLLAITKDSWAGITNNIIYINVILLTLYFIFYSGTKFVSDMKMLFYIALIVTASIDCIVSINTNWNITQVLSVFYADYDSTEELLNYVKEQDNSNFYRIENTQMLTLNDASWYNYHGFTTFSSMAYESMAKLMRKLGIPGNGINSYYYVQSTPIVDMMFDIKYFIGESNDTKRYTPIKTIDETANKFNNNIGLIYGVNNSIKNWQYNSYNPFQIQNDYIYQSSGVKDVLEEAILDKTDELYDDGSEKIIKYSYVNPGDNLYFYSNNYNIDFIIIGGNVYYNNDNYSNYVGVTDEITYNYAESYDEKKVININSIADKVDVIIGYNGYVSNAFYVYQINNNKFVEAYNYLYSYKANISEFKESKITANISLDDNMSVYTSIPYDDGWHVLVDGNEVETYKNGDVLLGFDAGSGNHNIVIYYEANGLKQGLIISIISALIIIFSKKIHKFIDRFLPKKKTRLGKFIDKINNKLYKIFNNIFNKIKEGIKNIFGNITRKKKSS